LNLESAIHHDARAEEIISAIQPRVIRIGRSPQRWFHHVLLLTDGTVRIARDEGDATVSAPAVCVFPPSEGETLNVAAGSRGFLAGASPEIIGEAIGDHAESPALRLFSGTFSLMDGLDPSAAREMTPLFEGIIAELTQDRRASRMVVSAYMRLIITAAWRLAGAKINDTPRAGPVPILQHFRQAVEIGFRNHRSIQDYASELGISSDRLHAICRRTLDRSPIELVHDRMVQEAKLRLERSARSVQEISDGLGFRDPANFSHFFKRKAGISPMKYRTLTAIQVQGASIATSSDYHEWP
jgi:AraC-like DNA-binding protein